MLFNSPAFLFLFLPITYCIFLMLKKTNYGHLALGAIGLSSLVFYAYWDPRYLLLLVGSLTVNHFIGSALTKRGSDKRLLVAGVMANLGCLGWFKYADFFVANINAMTHADIPMPHVILPLGISFFTFVQIAYIVDAYRGTAGRHTFIEYLSFVTFFPHLIAGPILNHKSIIPQFHEIPARSYNWPMAATGLTLFIIGLFKKVIIADNMARYATPVFDAAMHGTVHTLDQSWVGLISYTLQIYFDFSGYSDMALGLGMLFGIRMPENFLSPYKSTSIIDFWRRWHITLSDFLKNYLYIPLGGSRKGPARQYINLLITMVLGGFWHGAGWTFMIWGGLHGSYLVINHFWRRIISEQISSLVIYRLFAWLLLMLCVMFAWIFFRSDDLATAFRVIEGLQNFRHIDPEWKKGLIPIGLVTVLALIAPNSIQIIAWAEGRDWKRRWYSYEPDKKWIIFSIVLALISLYTMVYNINHVSEFIYFRF